MTQPAIPGGDEPPSPEIVLAAAGTARLSPGREAPAHVTGPSPILHAGGRSLHRAPQNSHLRDEAARCRR